MGKKTTDNKSIIIVCEGSDTEFNYFSDVKRYILQNIPERYTQIKVVPLGSEIIKEKNPSRKSRGKLYPANNTKSQWHYWCLYEESEVLYEKYKKQPTRYVREAELYMKRYGYTNAWVVYDKDVHPDHEFARKHANTVPQLGIAFSSYCFEQWFLTHFVQSNMDYVHSECKDTAGNEITCGTGINKNDCQGNRCIAGRLRQENYIPTYRKGMTGVFFKYTLPNIHKAYYNAAWLRHLSNEVIYKQNPYTDVDIMLKELFGDLERIFWCSLGRPLSLGKYAFEVCVEDDSVCIRNTGKQPVVLSKKNTFWLSNNYQQIGSPIDTFSVILHTYSSYKLPVILHHFLVVNIDNYSIVFEIRKL